MRVELKNELKRAVSRLAIVGMVGGLAGACSTDSARFSQNPFSNPFSTADSGAEPATQTGSIPEPTPGGRAAVPPVRTASLPPLSTPAPRQAVPAPSAPRTASSGQPGWSAQGGSNVTVGANDTLASISDRYGVPPSAILSANDLSSARQVTPGTRIVIPVYSADGGGRERPKQVARAAEPAPAPAPGRVVSTSRIDVKTPAPKTVAEAATRPAKPRPGQKVAEAAPEPVRPAKAEKPAKPEKNARVERAAPAPKVASKPEPAPKPAAKPEPARKTPVRQAEAAKPVEAAKPAKPAVRQAEAPSRAAEAPVRQAEAPKPAPRVIEAAKPVQAAPAPAAPAPVKVAEAPKPVKEPESTGAISTEPTSGADFRWPARGRVINGFGSGGNEGVNIAVPDGTPVKAASDGVVAYAGSEVKGYGNLVLIRHDNGYVTAYAHNGDIDVKRGQKVARGQTIAKSGQSGNVTSPQLHFEVRKGSTPVDPMRYLASAN